MPLLLKHLTAGYMSSQVLWSARSARRSRHDCTRGTLYLTRRKRRFCVRDLQSSRQRFTPSPHLDVPTHALLPSLLANVEDWSQTIPRLPMLSNNTQARFTSPSDELGLRSFMEAVPVPPVGRGQTGNRAPELHRSFPSWSDFRLENEIRAVSSWGGPSCTLHRSRLTGK